MSDAPARGLAVVTGASSGLGWAYAESLAARGHRLLVTARREDRLRELAALLDARHSTDTQVVPCDLGEEAGLAALRAALSAQAEAPEVVVLNAGFGSRGPLWGLDRARESAMVRLNCVAVVDLAAHVLPGMVAAGRGAVVVVSSAAAWQPVPFMATYAATKAFELALAEAVGEELRGTGVRMLAVCPGPTATEFTTSPDGERAAWRWPIPIDEPELVVRATWRALARGRRRAPTGLVSRATLLAARVVPRPLLVWAAGATHRGSAAGGADGARSSRDPAGPAPPAS